MLLALRSLWEALPAPAPVPPRPTDFECDVSCIVCPPSWLGLPNDPNNPYLNLSSEAADVNNRITVVYPRDPPPLGRDFYSLGCLGWCFAPTQEEADLCALRQQVICDSTNPPDTRLRDPGAPPGPNNQVVTTSRQIYGNSPQTCLQTACAGTQSSFTTPANSFLDFTQAGADTKAYLYACERARGTDQQICLNDLSSDRICYFMDASVTIEATNTLSGVFSVVDGSLPDGMILDQLDPLIATIIGTPVNPGIFDFKIRFVEDITNYYAERNYSISVVGITNNQQLATCVSGFAYSETLILQGDPVGTPSYTVVAGSLPPGLSLNSVSGVISGTPTVFGTFGFTVRYQDDELICNRDFSIINDIGIFINMVWVTSTLFAGTGTGSGNGSGNTSTVYSDSGGPWAGGPANTASVADTGNMLVTSGAPINCQISWDFTFSHPTNTTQINVFVNGGNAFTRLNPPGLVIGTGNFVIPAGVNIPVVVNNSCDASSGNGPPPANDSKWNQSTLALRVL